MIGPVSGTGRAMMASLQQAIDKGMPPDQAVQYVKSMATSGVAPLTDLYAMMNQFQRLKQQQVQPPQTPPTIRDQLNIMDQMQRPQGIQQMQAPAPAGQPMNRGLGAIDAGLMEYPQFAGGGIVAFQSGGGAESDQGAALDVARERIMAMIEEAEQKGDLTTATILRGQLRRAMSGAVGGEMAGEAFGGLKSIGEFLRKDVQQGRPWADKPKPIRYFDAESTETVSAPAQTSAPVNTSVSPFANFSDMAAAARRGVVQDVAPAAVAPRVASGTQGTAQVPARKDPFVNLIEAERNRKFESIPDTFSGEEKQRVEKALAGLTSERKDAIRMALAQAGFGMAAAAARGGRQRTSTLGALAEGAIGGMQQYAAAQKEIRQTERELNKEMGALRRYQDEVARGERTAQRAFEEARADNIANLTAKSEQLKLSQAELAQQLKIANIRATGNERLADQLMGMYDAIVKEPDQAKRAQLQRAFDDRLAASERIIRSTTAGGVGTGTREAIAIQNAVEAAKDSNAYRVADREYNAAERAGDTERAQRALAKRNEILLNARRQAESVLGVSGGSSPVPTIGGGTYQGPYSGFKATLID